MANDFSAVLIYADEERIDEIRAGLPSVCRPSRVGLPHIRFGGQEWRCYVVPVPLRWPREERADVRVSLEHMCDADMLVTNDLGLLPQPAPEED